MPVALGDGEFAFLRPAAVPIHDDGDVIRHVAVLFEPLLDTDVFRVVLGI